eukprot:CAMPEP_0202016120 /NCGR_PEP_ID=MMETSP0905-20130828/33664_1 /ASSEMBLY_ACC=CAM_ASM_000554 /TAXON_ID=420261 /ORGANISM="Thalassiosira antarctica, Strain CCMP982" /LENGTH=72 /DNA_ID=CAMNT_0048576431 /DNA_START=14 /DNA_END=228 /DNA_ORIENTATION=+
MTTARIVLMAVIVTESARSALKMEHHQLEKLPPGELVTTKSVIPMALFIANIFTVKNPKNGKMTNCKKTPMP